MGVLLKTEALPGLKEYKYSSIDNSFLSRYILGPYWWRQVIHVFPLWMAYVELLLTSRSSIEEQLFEQTNNKT